MRREDMVEMEKVWKVVGNDTQRQVLRTFSYIIILWNNGPRKTFQAL